MRVLARSNSALRASSSDSVSDMLAVTVNHWKQTLQCCLQLGRLQYSVSCVPARSDMECLNSLVSASDASRQAVHALLAAHGRQWDRRFPFGDPVSADTGHVTLLKSRDYVVADKSDGVRAACILTSSVHEYGELAYHSVLMDRRGVLYGFSISTDAAFFEHGTVLDGEIVQNRHNGQWMYVIFDAAVLAGCKLTQPLLERLELCKLFTHASESKHVKLHVKPMFALRGLSLEALEEHMDALPYRTDGYILTPNADAPAGPGTCEHIIKLKTCHTMDFQHRDGMLWFGDERELFPVTRLGLRFDVAQLHAIPNGAIVEMSPSVNTSDASASIFLHVLQVREDKTAPNAYTTITRTLRSVRDNVTLNSLLITEQSELLPLHRLQ